MLIAHLQMPMRPEPGDIRQQYAVMLTNLEAVSLTFRLRFQITVPGTAQGQALAKSELNTKVKVGIGPNAFSTLWTGSGALLELHQSLPLAAGRTTVVSLRLYAAIEPYSSLQEFMDYGLRGTTSLTLPTAAGKAQLDHPAHVMATAHLVNPGAAVRAVLPPVGGSPEFFIPPDLPGNFGVGTKPPAGASPKRAAKRAPKR